MLTSMKSARSQSRQNAMQKVHLTTQHVQNSAARSLSTSTKKHQQEIRNQLKQLPRGSKKWWKLNRALLQKKASTCSIPPLKSATTGDWALNPQDKADLLASTFTRKRQLPPEYEPLVEFEVPNYTLGEFLPIRRRVAKRVLKAINVDKATGPDLLPGSILHRFYEVLSLPVVLLTRLILGKGRWPELWRLHWICALYKKGAASSDENYRGVHLTCILSKCVERCLAAILVPYLEYTWAYGETQWAFQKHRSHADLLAYLVLTWILGLEEGHKVAVLFGHIWCLRSCTCCTLAE